MADDMWRAPANRLMQKLDRSRFTRTIPLKAARVLNNKSISKCRSALEKSRDVLAQDRLPAIFPDPDPELAKAGRKCIVLRPEVSTQNISSAETNGSPWPHSQTVNELIDQKLVSLIPYSLQLDYTFWTYWDILSSILPEDEQGEIPSGFNQVGHVAHLNLRREYLKYKHLIAEILLDKNPGCRTVINKIDDVGEENEYRTFQYEVLAGPDDLNVTVSEENCIFSFDYSKVYWNSKLNTEHRRLVSTFKEGDAVCDVMAGVGPFVVPAGKKRIFSFANDLNPDSYKYLQQAIAQNHVQGFVQAFNEDGRTFIPEAVVKLAATEHTVDITERRSRKKAKAEPPVKKTITQPRTFQHFVLNLPATALTFLPSFIGLYPQAVRDTLPPDFEMPLIHVYCFSTKSDDNVEEGKKICQEISGHLDHEMQPGRIDEDDKVYVHDVRDVAPKKRMFCASFRLPRAVAYRGV